MQKVLAAIGLIIGIIFVLLSCSEPSGPLNVSNPSPSILTVTLDEIDGYQFTGNTGSHALTDLISISGDASLERNGKGEYEAHAVWTQCPDENFAWYVIYRSDTPGIASNPGDADTSIVFSSVSNTSWNDMDISEGNTYYYALKTVNTDDLASWSNEDSIVVPAAAPPTPSLLAAAYTGDGLVAQITLEWTECPDSDFYLCKLYRSENPDIESDPLLADLILSTGVSTDTTYEDNDIIGQTSYYYAVETVDESQLSSWSNEVSLTTPDLTPRLTVFFIDPSHNDHYSGDVILLKTPDLRYYLIDGGDRAGSWSCGVEKVLPLLDSLGADSLDGIVGTHPHSDHIGGLIGVLQNVPVATVWDPGLSYSTSTYQDFLQAIYDNGADYITPRRGDLLEWDDNLIVECLHPAEPLSSDPNNVSIVLRVTFDEISFLFTGDLETSGGEDELLDALSQGIIEDITADVLKVGHHGSSTSTSNSWLQAVDPVYAAIEVGYGNPYDHPHDEVLLRLENYGASIYRTDQDGTFIISTDGTDLQIYP